MAPAGLLIAQRSRMPQPGTLGCRLYWHGGVGGLLPSWSRAVDHPFKIVSLLLVVVYIVVLARAAGAYQIAQRDAPENEALVARAKRTLHRLLIAAPLLLLGIAGVAWMLGVPIS